MVTQRHTEELVEICYELASLDFVSCNYLSETFKLSCPKLVTTEICFND